ncbi:hypothetical protein SARC_06959 [Sphaeroforma arctica JP610]|uniref:Uncharacterized protein n=1 Tax=Sphaeroforma arctica JP610 TaxID=667725 RepID=A0A0L0FXK3_9EUKA|nr:hypothetical protein SARC_06959 [Sphaeroforma arctica JP610]KNC80683.1 hypothetical protein SARC_06959 [Sphaeroforma arctica JP610]|eukprot:XP_014154585.1 hypothetical protein SARC_06959 [Sphaeroforma arctica JP610]
MSLFGYLRTRPAMGVLMRPSVVRGMCMRTYTTSEPSEATPAPTASSDKVCVYLNEKPQIHESCFIADNATVLGRVRMGQNSSVFYNCTLRADINHITIGNESNIQDNTVIHVSSTSGVTIGNGVTVGHSALIHACTVEDNVLVGMGSIIMDGATIGRDSIVAAGALVPMDVTYPERSLIIGRPAKVDRQLEEEEVENLRAQSAKYIKVMTEHKNFNKM